MKTYTYHINANERGEFFADVRNDDGMPVYEIDTAAMSDLLIDGFMQDVTDVDGLREYLTGLGYMSEDDDLIEGE